MSDARVCPKSCVKLPSGIHLLDGGFGRRAEGHTPARDTLPPKCSAILVAYRKAAATEIAEPANC